MANIKINKKLAKSISYGAKRSRKNVFYIVIHYTGNKGDTAKNNAVYFATSNERSAGAHFFVDKKGEVWKSVNVNRIAYAVGGLYSQSGGAGTYYGKCTNANSVSIELCDCCKDTNWTQMKAVRQLVLYIQKKCPNAKTIIRHWDVNGKACPVSMTGTSNSKWRRLHSYITKGYQYKAKIKDDAVIYSKPDAFSLKQGIKRAGSVVYITKISANGKWGRLKKKSADGRYRWVLLGKLKEM